MDLLFALTVGFSVAGLILAVVNILSWQDKKDDIPKPHAKKRNGIQRTDHRY
jgi:hypothetical protein